MKVLRREQTPEVLEDAAPAEGLPEPESPAPALARAISSQGSPQLARSIVTFRASAPPGVATLARKPASTTGTLSLGSKGLELIKSFEGVRLGAYQDSVGVWTIGYGHTGGVRPGQRITQAQADEFLRSDCQRFVNAVNKKVTVALNQNQFDALVSLSFNLGENGWKGLLAKLNAGDYAGAQKAFLQYVHAGGKVLKGLVRRRQAESDLFGSGGANEPSKPGKPSEPGKPGKPPGKPGGGGGGTYTVKRGDTLWAMSRRHGMNLKELLAIPANAKFRKNPDLIFPGQVVAVNKNARGPAPHKGKPKEPGKPKQPQPGGSNNAGAIAARYLGRNASEAQAQQGHPDGPERPQQRLLRQLRLRLPRAGRPRRSSRLPGRSPAPGRSRWWCRRRRRRRSCSRPRAPSGRPCSRADP